MAGCLISGSAPIAAIAFWVSWLPSTSTSSTPSRAVTDMRPEMLSKWPVYGSSSLAVSEAASGAVLLRPRNCSSAHSTMYLLTIGPPGPPLVIEMMAKLRPGT